MMYDSTLGSFAMLCVAGISDLDIFLASEKFIRTSIL